MKTLLAVGLFVLSSIITVSAQTECASAEQTALYSRFLVEAKAPIDQQALASLTAKEYLGKYGECSSESEKKITEYVKGWLDKYEATIVDFKCGRAVDKQPAQAFEICKPYLARDPENLRAYLLLAAAGIKSGEKNLRPETVKAARKALELVRSGKSVENWLVATSKEEAVGTLEFYSGYYTIDSTPAETASTMHSLAKSSTTFAKDPNVYFYLARSLNESELKTLKADYVKNCGGPDPPESCDAAYSNIESVMDRIIDAYARSINLSIGKKEFASIITVAKPELTKLYKLRHENATDADIDKFVTDVLSATLP